MSNQLIFQRIAMVNRDIDAIGKSQRNQQQGFQYRGIDDAYNALHDLLARHGIVTTPRVVGRDFEERQSSRGNALFVTRLMVEYDFWCEDGSKITVGPVLGEAMDSGDKGANKALAIAHKYALFQTFTIPTLFSDPDAETHEVVSNLASSKTMKDIDSLREYLPKVTQKWLDDNKDRITQPQAERILAKAQEEYAKSEAEIANHEAAMDEAEGGDDE